MLYLLTNVKRDKNIKLMIYAVLKCIISLNIENTQMGLCRGC